MSTDVLAPPHPILACAGRVQAKLQAVSPAQPRYLTTQEKQAALVDLARAETMLTELRLRVLAVADEVGTESGARDAAAWASAATRTDPLTARADLQLAKSLDTRELVAGGMRDGRVNAAQARVITAGLDDLPGHVGSEVVRSAEQTLVGYAADHRPAELRRLARRILDVVAPEIAEAELARQLEAEEARARDKATLRIQPLGHGRTRISGVLPDSAAHRLASYLDAYTSPRHRDGSSGGGMVDELDRIPLRRRRAHAFIALLEQLDPTTLPVHGGDATTLIVTIGLDQLRADLATAAILGAGDLSAEEARRLACTATILPAVLDGAGHVLDLGRGQRLFTSAQRKALRLRDVQCRAEGCTIPATWTEAHHLTPWSHGGATDLANAISLCAHHHHRVHDHRYDHERQPNGDLRFHRRT